MSRDSHRKGPNYIHPVKASAVGSRNSSHRSGRNEYAESKVIIDDEIDKVLNHVEAKLPPEVLEKLHVGGTVKEILHNYYNQGFQNMYNRYLVTVEDEMSKKFRDMVDKEESKNLSGYASREVTEMLDQMGGVENFNNEELETSIVDIYHHLQSHVDKASFDLDRRTAAILKEKADIGALVDGNQSFSLVKCLIADNQVKPETVSDLILAINVLEAEMLNPVFHFNIGAEHVIKEVISDHILNRIDEEVDRLAKESGEEELGDKERLFKKINLVGDHIDEDDGAEDARQYDFVAKEILEVISGAGDELEADALGVNANIQRIVDKEALRTKGFHASVNALTHILDSSKLGYQHIENFKNVRKVVIREYEETASVDLPDERYSVTLSYNDNEQLREMRAAYCQQMEEFEAEIDKLWAVFDKVFETEKDDREMLDYMDVAESVLSEEDTGKKGKKGQEPEESDEKEDVWNEISFLALGKDDQVRANETFTQKRKYLKKKLGLVAEKIQRLYKMDNPAERVVLDRRVEFLKDRFEQFTRQYNPFHVKPGILVELQISTIKRQEETLKSMSYVMQDFLNEVSKGFSDPGIEAFKTRKQAEAVDNSHVFSSPPEATAVEETAE